MYYRQLIRDRVVIEHKINLCNKLFINHNFLEKQYNIEIILKNLGNKLNTIKKISLTPITIAIHQSISKR